VAQAVVVAARAAAVARVAVVPAAEAIAAAARVVVAAAEAAVVVAATAVEVVATKTATVNLAIAPVIVARGVRAATVTIVVIEWIRTAREIAYSFVTQMFRGTEIGIATGIVTAIVIVAAIEIVIATEIEIASTKALAFTIRRIMAGTSTAPMLMSRATETACSQAQTMAAESRITTLSVRTSTEAAHPAGSSRCSPMGLTDKLIEMALCAAIRRDIRAGRRTLWAGAFAVSCLHTRQFRKFIPPQVDLQEISLASPQEVFR
jgi:hypothetical protein